MFGLIISKESSRGSLRNAHCRFVCRFVPMVREKELPSNAVSWRQLNGRSESWHLITPPFITHNLLPVKYVTQRPYLLRQWFQADTGHLWCIIALQWKPSGVAGCNAFGSNKATLARIGKSCLITAMFYCTLCVTLAVYLQVKYLNS